MRPGVTPWLAFCDPRPKTPLRLFCFPHAGGGASSFRTWSRDLPLEVDVCPVQYPGRETRIREKLYTELGPLVEDASLALLPFLDSPFCFLGHSMGALVAFELARLLNRRHGICPAHLIVCGYWAPQLPNQSALRHDLPREDFIRELRNLDGTPKEALDSPELIEFMLPPLRADCRICDLYEFVSGEPLPCSITAYGGIRDVDSDEDALLAWREQTRSAFELRMFPGGHFFPQTSRQAVLAALGAELRRLMGAG